MRQKSGPRKAPSEKVVKDIRRATRKRHSSEEKIRIVLDGLRGEGSIAELCHREGIALANPLAEVLLDNLQMIGIGRPSLGPRP